MTSTEIDRDFWTPKQLAERLQVSYDHIMYLISTGVIPALNVARPGSQRARYRVNDADRLEYENGAAVPLPTALLRKRRQRTMRPSDVIEFFQR